MSSYGASVGGDGFLRRALAGEGFGGEFAAALVRFEWAGLGDFGEVFGFVFQDEMPHEQDVGCREAGGEDEDEEFRQLDHMGFVVQPDTRRPQFIA